MDNILEQSMIDTDWYNGIGKRIDVGELKIGDVVKLKDSKYAKIISGGEYCDDIDYGMMYKNIKRFEYIDQDTYHLLWLEKERDKHEKIIFKHKKEKYRLDLLIYLNKNRITLSDEYDSKLYEEFRASRTICHMEDIGVFYETDEGIKQMVTAGYVTLFYKTSLTEETILRIKQHYDITNKATKSIDVLDFSETIK